MKEWFGFPLSIRHLGRMARAAQLRVMTFEIPTFEAKYQALRDAMVDNEVGHLHIFRDWHTSGIWKQYTQTAIDIRTEGMAWNTSGERVRRSLPQPPESARDPAVRKVLQKWTYNWLQAKRPDIGAYRIRARLDRRRSRLPGPPRLRQRSERAQTNFRKMSKLLPPRVFVVCFKTLWNAWYTDRRCGQRDTECKMSCHHEHGRDSLEHYMHCKVIHAFGIEYLQLPRHIVENIDFWFLFTVFPNDDTIIRMALLQFCAYSLRNHNAARPESTAFRPHEFMRVTAIRAAAGAPRCMAVLRANRARWTTPNGQEGNGVLI